MSHIQCPGKKTCPVLQGGCTFMRSRQLPFLWGQATAALAGEGVACAERSCATFAAARLQGRAGTAESGVPSGRGWNRSTAARASHSGITSIPASSRRRADRTHRRRHSHEARRLPAHAPQRRGIRRGPPAINPAKAGPRRRQDHTQSQHHRLLDRHRARRSADEPHRPRATAPAARGGGHPRIPGALVPLPASPAGAQLEWVRN